MVTSSHVHCKSGSISEIMQGRDVTQTSDMKWPWVTFKGIHLL